MKKISFLIVIALLLASFASCGGGSEAETTTNAPETTEAAAPGVDLVIQKDQLSDPEKVIAEMKNYGAEVADMSDAGGGYIFSFSAEEHQKLLDDKRAATEKIYEEMKSSEGSYIEKIEYDDSFREIKVFVNREKYDMSEDKEQEFILGLRALAYQLYTGEWQSTFVKVYYSDNEDVVHSFKLPVEISIDQ